jgi:hypothetical protein
MKRSFWLNVLSALLFLASAGNARAQTTSGSIVGSVTDPSGLAVSAAAVTLTNTGTGAERKALTTATGDFAFRVLEPGNYRLSVVAQGFKRAEQTSINLTASETLSLGAIVLEVGAVAESVTVQARGASVQTASTEHSGLLTGDQVEDLLIKGRNVQTLLQLLPGVVDTNVPDAPDRNFAIGLSANGGRRNSVNMTVAGVSTNAALSNGWVNDLNVSMDAASEVKVMLNNYQAEYGGVRGATVEIIPKSGTRQFHGSFSYFKRHEEFNANNFFNNRVGLPKPLYRYNTYSYTIGGPVYVPRKWNQDMNKLFFFWSQEFWPLKGTNGVQSVTMPTALERVGDFSQSLDLNGKLIPVKDPTTGQVFPDNIVPANRLDPNGQALLKIFPLPNFTNRAISGGQYNYVVDSPLDKPQRLQTMKIDFNPTSRDLISVSWSRQRDLQTGAQGLATPNANWPQNYRSFDTRGNLVSIHYSKILSPTLINEVILGDVWRPEFETVPDATAAADSRSNQGFKLGQLFPGANPMGLLPDATFGGVTNAANLNIGAKFPAKGNYAAYSAADNVTKTLGAHTFKAGIFYVRGSNSQRFTVAGHGIFDFGTNVNNPLNSGYAFANAVIGVYNSYQESNGWPYTDSGIGKSIEWYVQDSWKVSRSLTLELGLRFYEDLPAYSNHTVAEFDLSKWNPAQAVQLIRPALVNGQRMGINPVDGQIYPVAAIGAIAPGSGNPANGMAISTDPGYNAAMIQRAGLGLGPRVGFAWDITGDGKTALRGGFGIFSTQGTLGETLPGGLPANETQFPLFETVTLYYGTLNSLLSSGGLLSPTSVLGQPAQAVNEKSYNASLSIQRNLGFGTVLDVGYVGTFGRHLPMATDGDPIPMGAHFSPQNADPTNTKVPLPDSFLRPLVGFSGVTLRRWEANSSYHSLQTTVNRRFAAGLQVGASWTWSKFMDYGDFDTSGALSPFIPWRVWNYQMSTYDRTHNLRVSFLYDLPKTPWKNLVSRWVLNGWMLSGITSFISGAPAGVGFTTTNSIDITGTPSQSARIVVTGNPVLPKDQRTFSQNFQTRVFQQPAIGTVGNAAPYILRGPGINNWDLAIFKNFPIREPLKLQLRCEMYNAFNHTQFSAWNTTARFDATGAQINNQLGQATAAYNPRQIQLAVRFLF